MSNGGNPAALLPLLIFMAVMIGIGFYVRQVQARGFGRNFVQQYFIGNHDLGGFVLAMTTVATYSSVSSFVGGPGMAWQIGFGWIYMAVVQVTAIFLVLGIFGINQRLGKLWRDAWETPTAICHDGRNRQPLAVGSLQVWRTHGKYFSVR